MVAQLPPELLSQIFLEIQKAHFWDGHEEAPPCCAVSQVCRRWRAAALGTSKLWTHIPIRNPLWAEACLSRVREQCIEVSPACIAPDDPLERRSMMLLYPELPRISALAFYTETNFYDCDELLAEVFAGLSRYTAPKLQELCISIIDCVDSDRPPIILPNSLFGSQKLSVLESATFFSCELSLSWAQTFLAPSLCSLELNGCRVWKNVDEMVQFFKLIPNLQSLRLRTANIRTESFDTTQSRIYPPRAVPLPKLRSFDVFTRYLEHIAIFAYLLFPPTTSINMCIHELDTDLKGDVEEEEIRKAICMGIVTFKDHFAPAVAAGYGYTHVRLSSRGIDIPCYSPCDLHMNGGYKNNSASQIPTPLAPLNLRFGISKPDPHLLRPAYAMLLEQAIFETTTTLCVPGNLPPEAYSCLKRWTAVEALEIPKSHKSALPGFVAAVLQQPFRLFPGLRRLQVVDAIIIEPNEPQGESEMAWDKVTEGEGLRGTDARAFVAAAKKLAHYEHFERLVFIRCVVSTRAFQEVKDVLGAQRVEGDTQKPEERVKEREERKSRKYHWSDPEAYRMPSED